MTRDKTLVIDIKFKRSKRNLLKYVSYLFCYITSINILIPMNFAYINQNEVPCQ